MEREREELALAAAPVEPEVFWRRGAAYGCDWFESMARECDAVCWTGLCT